MERILKSEVAKILLLLSFLLLIPFISTSLRSSYLYFLLNLLIIVLGVEAGLLATSVSQPRMHVDVVDKKPPLLAMSHGEYLDRRSTQAPPVEKKMAELVAAERRVQKLKRCRSRPSIFFIGSSSCDNIEDLAAAGEEEEAVAGEELKVAAVLQEGYSAGELMSKQELFMKAEMFIGNFYKQLKMQREESWKKIHGLYHI